MNKSIKESKMNNTYERVMLGDNELVQLNDSVHVYLQDITDKNNEVDYITERRNRYKKTVRDLSQDVFKIVKPTVLVADSINDNTYIVAPYNASYMINYFVTTGQYNVANDILDAMIENTSEDVITN